MVHNGICVGEAPNRALAGAALRGELGLDSDARLVGAVGRLDAQKGLHRLLEAAPMVLERVPSTHFVFAGCGALEMQLREQACSLGISHRVHWLGFRSCAQTVMAGLDVLAMPSEYEGLPITLLEALANQVPVVAHRVDGIPEVVRDGVEGVLVEHGDTAGLAEGIVSVLLNGEYAARLGIAGRRRVMEEFSVQRMCSRMLDVYRSAVGEADVPLCAEA